MGPYIKYDRPLNKIAQYAQDLRNKKRLYLRNEMRKISKKRLDEFRIKLAKKRKLTRWFVVLNFNK